MVFEIIQYLSSNSSKYLEALREHIVLSLVAVIIAVIISVPLGIICVKYYKISAVIMNTFNILRIIPSLAVLVAVIPIMGTGFAPALLALFLLACPPMIINTYLGFKNIDNNILEVSSGMGMDKRQIFVKIELPMAIPLIITGIRTASVEVFSSATLAAYIGAGGLGTYIMLGLGLNNYTYLLIGGISVAILAVSVEIILSFVYSYMTRYKRA